MLLLTCYAEHPDLLSYPTRRSSDLRRRRQWMGWRHEPIVRRRPVRGRAGTELLRVAECPALPHRDEALPCAVPPSASSCFDNTKKYHLSTRIVGFWRTIHPALEQITKNQ